MVPVFNRIGRKYISKKCSVRISEDVFLLVAASLNLFPAFKKLSYDTIIEGLNAKLGIEILEDWE